MTTGMLWFDDSKASLSEKVSKAAAYYQKKYGQAPNLCFIRFGESITGPCVVSTDAGPVQIRETRTLMTNHLWLGVQAEA